MNHPKSNTESPIRGSKTALKRKLPWLALCTAMLIPVAASADPGSRAGLRSEHQAVKVGHVRDHRHDRHDSRIERKRDRRADRRAERRIERRIDRKIERRIDRQLLRHAPVRHARQHRQGYNTRYFVRPWEPLNFKHWWRVERQFSRYTPNLRHLNRYERKEVLNHGYNRYLRDHRRWSKRAQRDRRHARLDRQRGRLIARIEHDWRNCDDRSHRHGRRW
jgi:hypothetical protein